MQELPNVLVSLCAGIWNTVSDENSFEIAPDENRDIQGGKNIYGHNERDMTIEYYRTCTVGVWLDTLQIDLAQSTFINE